MADEKTIKNAKSTFNTLCTYLDKIGWHYEKHEEDLTIHFGVRGDDLPMDFFIELDADRELIKLFSPLPFNFDESKRVEGAIVICRANYKLADGYFDYNYKDGGILYKITNSFKSSLMSQEFFRYLVGVSVSTVDQFNDKFLMVSKGVMPVEDFFKL